MVIFQQAAVTEQCLDTFRDTHLVLNLGLDTSYGIIWYHTKGNILTSDGLDGHIHQQVKCGPFLDVVIR